MTDPLNVKIELSTPSWKTRGEHAVTGLGSYDDEPKFVKLVCLTPMTVNRNKSTNKNRLREVDANAAVRTMIENLRRADDRRADCFLAATIVRVGDKVPEWARPWIAEYQTHASFDVNSKREYAFLFMRNLANAQPLYAWWTRKSGHEFRDRALMAAQMVSVLEALADAKITHADMHWANVMVETLDPPVEIALGGVSGFLTRHRPVVFDWDRAVVGDRHDRHYDLIGFYKNLTQKYGPTEQSFWRLVLHPYFEATFDAFPSLAVNHEHHPNPCLVGFEEEGKLLVDEYRWKTDPECQENLPPRPDECLAAWWPDVAAWTAYPHKPSHADIVRRICEGIVPDTPRSPRATDDVKPIQTRIDDKMRKANEACAETKRAMQVIEKLEDKPHELQNLAEWVQDASNRARENLLDVANAAVLVEEESSSVGVARDALVDLRTKIEAEMNAVRKAASVLVEALESSHEMARATERFVSLFSAVYVSVEV